MTSYLSTPLNTAVHAFWVKTKKNSFLQQSQETGLLSLTIEPFCSPIKDKKSAMVAGVVRPEQPKETGSVGYEGNPEVS